MRTSRGLQAKCFGAAWSCKNEKALGFIAIAHRLSLNVRSNECIFAPMSERMHRVSLYNSRRIV